MLLNSNTYSLKYAPGENKQPLGLLIDLNAERLSFPSIFCGQMSKLNKNLSYCKLVKSRFRRYDRRCASNVTYLLYAYKTLQIQQISKAVDTSLRKKFSNQSLTAGDLCDKTFLEHLISHDDAYI